MNRAIFLDRDGVINELIFDGEKFVSPHKLNEFKLLPNTAEPIKRLHDFGFKMLLISNQPDVSKGLMTKENLDEMTDKMQIFFEKNGSKLDAVYYCLHKKEDNCNCRKPKTGLFERARDDFQIDFAASYVIGDSIKELEAAKKIGSKSILVDGIQFDQEKIREFPPIAQVANISEASSVILNLEANSR